MRRRHLRDGRENPNWYLRYADVLALVYFLNCQSSEYPFATLGAKVGSTFFLALHSLLKNPLNRLLNCALLAHCAGDALIGTSRISSISEEDAMLLALAAFFLGHILCLMHQNKTRLCMNEMGVAKRFGVMAFTFGSAYITQFIASSASGVFCAPLRRVEYYSCWGGSPDSSICPVALAHPSWEAAAEADEGVASIPLA